MSDDPSPRDELSLQEQVRQALVDTRRLGYWRIAEADAELLLLAAKKVPGHRNALTTKKKLKLLLVYAIEQCFDDDQRLRDCVLATFCLTDPLEARNLPAAKALRALEAHGRRQSSFGRLIAAQIHYSNDNVSESQCDSFQIHHEKPAIMDLSELITRLLDADDSTDLRDLSWLLETPTARMDHEHAFQYVREHLPDETPEDWYRLVYALDRHQELIEQACACLLDNPEVRIKAFCQALAEDPALILNAIRKDSGTPLDTRFREEILPALEKHHHSSVELLRLLTFGYHRCVPIEYVMSYLAGRPYIPAEDLWLHLEAFRRAVKPLETYKLVTVNSYFLHISPLAQAIWRTVFSDQFTTVADRLRPISQFRDWATYTRHGWGPMSHAGRMICSLAVAARSRSRAAAAIGESFDSKLAGSEWNELMLKMWWRYFNFYWESMLPRESGPEVGGYPRLFETKHSLQLEETVDSLCLRMTRSAAPAAEGAQSQSAGPRYGIYLLVQIEHLRHRLNNLIVKSPLGQLDLREIGELPKP